MSSNLTVINYLERSNALKEIQQDYAKAGKDQVDLKHTAAKLQYLVKAMNDDIAAINQGTKVSPEVRQAYLNHREELKDATARVNQTEQKTNDNRLLSKLNF
jgi:septal ring factor EnvC (AmiA/AmiB activator)